MPTLTIKNAGENIIEDIMGKSLLSVIMRNAPDGLPEDISLYIGREKVNVLEFNIDRVFDCDCVLIVPPKGLVTGIIIGSILVAGATTYYLQKKLAGQQQATPEQSPNNEFYGQTNRVRIDQQLPNVYGSGPVFPDVIGAEGGSYEYINNTKVISEIFCVSIGQGEKSEPRFEKTPLSTIPEATYNYYENGQLVPVVQGQFNSEIVDGQTLVGPNNDEITDGDTTATTDNRSRSNDGSKLSFTVNDTDANYSSWEALADRFGLTGGWRVRVTYSVYQLNDDNPQVCELVQYVTNGFVDRCARVSVGSGVSVDITGSFQVADCDQGGIQISPNINTVELVGGSVTVQMPIPTNEVQTSVSFQNGLRGTAVIETRISYTQGGVTKRLFFSDTYSANTSSQRFFTEKRDLGSGAVTNLIVIMSRLNNDKSDNTDRCQLEQVATNEYRYNVDYGDLTILTTERKATQQALKFAQSKINLDWTRYTVQYDRNTGNMITTLAPSRSFADCILHEYTQINKLPSSELPLAEMYEIADRIGELGNFDYTFADKDQSLFSKLNIIANVARCKIWYNGESWEIFRDEPRLPVAQFDSRNIDSSSPETISYKSPQETSNDGIKLRYINGDNKPAYIYYVIISGVSTKCVDQGGGFYSPARPQRPLEIELTGSRTTSQADDRARIECNKLIYVTESRSTTALKDGDNLTVGDVVRYGDYYYDDVATGEISTINGDIYTSYSEIDLPLGTYYVTYTNEIGQSLGPAQVDLISKTQFQGSLPEAYAADGFSVQCGSRFILSTLEEAELSMYEIVDKIPTDRGSYNIELVQYSDSVY